MTPYSKVYSKVGNYNLVSVNAFDKQTIKHYQIVDVSSFDLHPMIFDKGCNVPVLRRNITTND